MLDEGTEGKMVSDYLRTQQFTRSVNMYGYYYNHNLQLSYLYVGIRQGFLSKMLVPSIGRDLSKQ